MGTLSRRDPATTPALQPEASLNMWVCVHSGQVCFVMYTGVFHYLANIPLDVHPLYVSVQKRFWMQADVLLYMLMGVSVATFFDMCKCISSPLRISLFVDVAQSTWQTVISAAVVALLAVRVSDGWVQAQQSDNW